MKINLDRAELAYKWVPAKNYHVTSAFLGELDVLQKTTVTKKLYEIQEHLLPFDLLISGVDAFSSEREARLIYCGVQNKKSLRALVDLTRAAIGLEPDETYSPHLSIARLRNPANVRDIISPVKRKDFFKVKINEIRLYRSRLTGPFPIYEILEKIEFKKNEISQSF